MTIKQATRRSTATKLAVAYLRCSSDKQPLSLGDQRRAIELWAAGRGITIVRWYTDDAISGASAANRAQFQKMIAEVEKQRDVANVLCYDVSRFGRTDTDEAGFYRFRLRQAGAEVVYVAETAVNGSETDDLLLPVLQYQKREYLRSLSRDTLRGLMGLAKRGAWCGGPAPFGYGRELRDRDGKPVRVLARGERAVTDDGSAVFLIPGAAREVEAVRLAWDMHWTERLGIDTIRDRFVAMGLLPPRGPAWRASTIRAIFLNPTYTGRASYGIRTKAKFFRATKDGSVARPKTASGIFEVDPTAEPIVVEGAHPVLVSPAATEAFRAWEQANRERRLRGDPHKRRNQYEVRSTFILSGIMRCGRCGYRFAGSTRRRKGNAYPEYICCGYSGCGAAFCTRFAIPQDDLEGRVLDEIERRWEVGIGADAVRARVEAEIERKLAPATPQDPQEIKRKLAAIDERMLAIVQNLSAEHADVANAALAHLKAARAALQRELTSTAEATEATEDAAAAAPVIAVLIARLADVLKKGAVPDRKAVLRAFVQEIVVQPVERAVDVTFWRLPRFAECHLLRTSEAPEIQRALQVAGPVSVEGVAGARIVLHL